MLLSTIQICLYSVTKFLFGCDVKKEKIFKSTSPSLNGRTNAVHMAFHSQVGLKSGQLSCSIASIDYTMAIKHSVFIPLQGSAIIDDKLKCILTT